MSAREDIMLREAAGAIEHLAKIAHFATHTVSLKDSFEECDERSCECYRTLIAKLKKAIKERQ